MARIVPDPYPLLIENVKNLPVIASQDQEFWLAAAISSIEVVESTAGKEPSAKRSKLSAALLLTVFERCIGAYETLVRSQRLPTRCRWPRVPPTAPWPLWSLLGLSSRIQRCGSTNWPGKFSAFVEPNDRTPRYHNWQFNIQRSLPSQTLVEVAYVGSRAINLFGGSDYDTVLSEQLNQLAPSYYSLGSALLQPVPNPFYGLITRGALSGPTVQRQQLLRPYPQFLNVTRQSAALGNSVYHSLQMKVEKRLKNGVTGLVSFTQSKTIYDIVNAQNAYDRRAERSVTSFDVPQRLTFSAAWELPFGRARQFFTNASRLSDVVIGGWQLSTFATFQSGFPLGVGLISPNLYIVGAGTQRPNAAGDPTAGISGSIESRLGHYFNTNAFAQPANFAFGNLSPRLSSLRAPGMNNIDLTLSKSFRINEKVKVDFRATSYNLLNHPVFSAPNTTFGDASFGRVSGQANFSRQTEFVMKLVF